MTLDCLNTRQGGKRFLDNNFVVVIELRICLSKRVQWVIKQPFQGLSALPANRGQSLRHPLKGWAQSLKIFCLIQVCLLLAKLGNCKASVLMSDGAKLLAQHRRSRSVKTVFQWGEMWCRVRSTQCPSQVTGRSVKGFVSGSWAVLLVGQGCRFGVTWKHHRHHSLTRCWKHTHTRTRTPVHSGIGMLRFCS